MKIYLAARYSRREELCVYRTQLEELGHTVTSRWLNGKHQIDSAGKPIGDAGESLVEDHDDSTHVKAAALRESFAREDLQDVLATDLLIAFTEVPRSGHSRGGRHVELGIAIGRQTPVCIVGPRENIFCWLPDIPVFESFDDFLEVL